ncbi:hypothetical protein ACPW7J_08910 [Ihubacter sp. rT4E-8]|uniref:hypothetical protein n=1 Tax=Ihubacter sp. rT4E-8 TaxID=3242369 RepID=UPI0013797BB8
MNGQTEIKYKKEKVPNYVLDILTAGAGSLFLPVGFVRDEEFLFGHYKTEGYRKLTAMKEIGTEDILGIVLGLLHGIWQGERVYLFSEIYEILPEYIFVSRGYDVIKMVFVPAEEQKKLTDKLRDLLLYLRERGHSEGYAYIDQALEFLHEDWGYRALVHRLESLRREVYLCSVK